MTTSDDVVPDLSVDDINQIIANQTPPTSSLLPGAISPIFEESEASVTPGTDTSSLNAHAQIKIQEFNAEVGQDRTLLMNGVDIGDDYESGPHGDVGYGSGAEDDSPHHSHAEDALKQLRDQLNALQLFKLNDIERSESFKDLLKSPTIESLVKTVDVLSGAKPRRFPSVSPNSFNIGEFCGALLVLAERKSFGCDAVTELFDLLCTPNIRALITAYDSVAKREFEPSGDLMRSGLSYFDENPAQAYRIVGIRKPRGQDESLGLTVREENGALVIARILEDSPVAKQGLLHVGDTILEVNKESVHTADDLKEKLRKANTAVTMKLIPAPIDLPPAVQSYVKAYFDYDPDSDDAIPAKEIGLPFKAGDILQIISKDDDKYWQARKVYDHSRIGLVPAQTFQENRMAAKGGGDSSKKTLGGLITIKKKRKVMYDARTPAEFDRHELLVYEEVGKLSPYGRRVLVLLGASGVGRRTLKSRLLRYDPVHFATVIPFTSRGKRDGEVEGREYYFRTKDDLKKQVEKGEFLEWGEFNGNVYGTRLDSVREVIRGGKMCVLDCSPQAIKSLYNWEFMPFIVFVSPPPVDELKQLYANASANALKPKSPIQSASDKVPLWSVTPHNASKEEEELSRTCDESAKLSNAFHHFFDLQLVNRNAEVTFRRYEKPLIL